MEIPGRKTENRLARHRSGLVMELGQHEHRPTFAGRHEHDFTDRPASDFRIEAVHLDQPEYAAVEFHRAVEIVDHELGEQEIGIEVAAMGNRTGHP